MKLFSKMITNSDIFEGRLTFYFEPYVIGFLDKSFHGLTDFIVKDNITGILWNFGSIYAVINDRNLHGDWPEFVRRRGLLPGDRLTLYLFRDEDKSAHEVPYEIRAERKVISFLGEDIWVDVEADSIQDYHHPAEQSLEADDAHDLSNDSKYAIKPIDFLGALTSSQKENGDVFNGSGRERESIGTDLKNELSLHLLNQTEHLTNVTVDDVNREIHQRNACSQKSNDSQYAIDLPDFPGDLAASSSHQEDTDVFDNTRRLRKILSSLNLLDDYEEEYMINVKEDYVYRETHRRTNHWIQKADLEWISVIINFVIELPSAVFDQLSSVQKPRYAMLAMLMALIAMLICSVEFIYRGRKQRVAWRWRRKVPWFYYPSPRNNIRFGTFVDTVGLVCSILQVIVTAVNYSFCRRHVDGPIKISLWPIIFAIGLLCSKTLKHPNWRRGRSLKLELRRNYSI